MLCALVSATLMAVSIANAASAQVPLPGALEIRFPSLDNIELHVPCVEAGEVRYRVQRAGDQAS